jgi:hypothetical protein
LGLILFLALFVQGGLGWYHHKRYQEDKPTSRRWFTHLHLWLGRLLLFLALINIGLGMQLYGDGPGAQAGWYVISIALMALYTFFLWRNFYRTKKRANDAFDPSQFEDGTSEDGQKTYESFRPVNVAAMSDNDLGTYRSEYYDPVNSGVDEYGARVRTSHTLNRPTTAAPPATTAGRRYDIGPTPTLPGPFAPTEPLRMSIPQVDPQQDPFRDSPARPLTGARPRTGVPYPVSMVSHEEMPLSMAPSALPYSPLGNN